MPALTSRRCFDAVTQLVVSKNLRHHSNPESSEILSTIDSPYGPFLLRFKTRDAQDVIMIYSELNTKCPRSRIPAMTDFITRANFGLPVGGFELCITSGEIRFRVSLDVEQVDNLSGLLISLLARNVKTVDKYIPGVLAVIEGKSPKEAIDDCECDMPQPVVHRFPSNIEIEEKVEEENDEEITSSVQEESCDDVEDHESISSSFEEDESEVEVEMDAGKRRRFFSGGCVTM
ncbi:hypothetical protein GEMRC1_013509 [Eukaryota sp. GEM-RC1]